PSAALNGGARSEDVTTDVKQEISNKIGQQVQTLLLQAKKESEQKVTAELKLLHHAMQEMDSRLDGLVKQLDDMQVQPNQEALEQAAVVQALAKVEQQWGKELGKLKGELHQTIFAHNHNADLMKYQKETLDKIRQEIDSRNNSNPDKIRAAKAQVAKIETTSKVVGPRIATCEGEVEQSIFACAFMADGQHLAQSRYAEEISPDQPEVKLTWRPRDDFETAEGFIIHSSKFLASQWLRWLQDGKLSEVAEKFDPDVRKVLLSESAAKEACQQVRRFCERLDDRVPVELSQPLEDFCGCIGSREYVRANKAYMDIVMGSRKWQGDVPYLVEGNRNGPSVVQNVAERLNKTNANPLDQAGIRDHAVVLRRLLKVAQAVLPNEDPSKNCG
ncbi:unnamed protein product, partial [Symbiodinium necroappetens]